MVGGCAGSLERLHLESFLLPGRPSSLLGRHVPLLVLPVPLLGRPVPLLGRPAPLLVLPFPLLVLSFLFGCAWSYVRHKRKQEM